MASKASHIPFTPKASLGKRIIDAIEDVAVYLGSAFGGAANGYCDIETSDGPEVLVTKGGSLLSAIELRGVNFLVGSEEFEVMCQTLQRGLSPLLSNPGHVIQLWFQRDPDMTKDLLENSLEPNRAAARRIGLDVGDILDSKVEHLGRFCSDERCLIGIWTNDTVLTKQGASRAAKKKAKDLAQARPLMPKGCQNIVASNPDLREIHLSSLNSLEETFSEAGWYTRILSAHEMLRETRRAFAPSHTPHDWMPCLPGDPVPRMQKVQWENDVSEIGYPPIGPQLFVHDMVRSSNRVRVEVGDRIYAPMIVEKPCSELVPFSKLFQQTVSSNTPWRISFLFEPGGAESISFKAMIASFLVWASPYNRLLDEATQAIKAAEYAGEVCVKARISICTWAPSSRPDLLEDRAARLAKAVTSWGRTEVREHSGDPVAAFVATLPFLTLRTPANAFVAPIVDLVRLFPNDRLASAWSSGGVLFRTMDGRVIPFEPGSSLQSTWCYLFFARPGMGKSVLMATINLASCMGAGLEQLPYISYIDIGPSSKGFIDLIRDSLPEHLRHYAAHFKLRMTPEYSVNFMDTQLGLRFPLPDELSAMRSYLTLLATPAERSQPYDSMSSLCSKILEEAFKLYADNSKSNPKIYSPGVLPEVDQTLSLHKFHADRSTCWWEVVDFLFDRQEYHLAGLAQRYAVPTLEDIAAIANLPAINDLYGKVFLDNGESLNQAFARIIADKIRDFPILASVTRFDIGQARVLAIDLDEVAKSGNNNLHQCGLMYSLARFVATRHFRMHKDILPMIPSKYRAYYATKIQDIFGTMKWIIYDEFHRTSAVQAVRDQVLVDIREGRKWNLGVQLASQSSADFDATIKEFVTATFILNAGTHSNAEQLQSLFGFNDSSKRMLLTYANGPTAKGAPFLMQFTTNLKGDSSQFLMSTISPVEAWAFSTTAEDVMLRDVLYAEVGQRLARRMLAKAFPGGSAKKEVERLKRAMTGDEDDEAAQGAVRSIADRLLRENKDLLAELSYA